MLGKYIDRSYIKNDLKFDTSKEEGSCLSFIKSCLICVPTRQVSLTPHEPPLNVAVSNIRQPAQPHSYGAPVNQHLPAHTFPQCSDHFGDTQAESLYFQADGVSNSNSFINSLAQTASAMPQLTTKNQREIYNQNLQGIKDFPDVNGKVMPHTSESSDLYKPSTNNENGEDASHGPSEECMMNGRGNAGDKTQNGSRKTSSIPVFTSKSPSTLKSPRPEEKSKIHSILPKVAYKDKENVQPTTEVISQSYCRHKGSIVVKGLTKESDDDPQHLHSGSRSSSDGDSSHQQNMHRESEESLLTKDSIIVSHFRMQKEREERREELPSRVILGSKGGSVQKGVMSSSGSDNSQSDSQHSASDSRNSSQSSNKPSSCLKAPGSPSLRVKHVTFAHKLVHHQNGEAKLKSHFSQGEVSWRSLQSSQHVSLTRQDAVSPRNLTHSHSLNLEGSDLQVVPCREGDPQAHTHTATASAQGGVTVNGYGTSRPHDRTKEDLIMAFSWMNQNNECDTPCVSFIESKAPMENNIDSNGMCSSKSPSDEIMTAPSPSNSTSPKKSRKLRSRIAANFTLK